ncbi:uncharacterized protein [Prorops nasuta]|uniref:uncharacterized protein n=1 Tax=Prorops nasuta TaxID=863751 RepID=UPI0034CDE861
MSRPRVKSRKISLIEVDNQISRINIEKGSTKFTFQNGDIYVGGYLLIYHKKILVKQGLLRLINLKLKHYGEYKTNDFNVYQALWDDDRINEHVHIRFNNGAEYMGEAHSDGTLHGYGKYIFQDKSLIEGIWFENKPTNGLIYRDPLGYKWVSEDRSPNELKISFTLGNPFCVGHCLYIFYIHYVKLANISGAEWITK